MKTFTRADVLSWNPCHGKTKTLSIMRGLPRRMTALDVLRHEDATPADRMWCVLRSQVLDDRTLRLFAAWCARTALDTMRAAGREPDVRSWRAVEVAERYALGQATDDELRAARAAAHDAARAALTRPAARAADAADAADAALAALAALTRPAARAAADAAAAYAAVSAAARTAVSAYAAAAYAAARAAQIERLVELIEENEK